VIILNDKTIKELADELGVSKQAIRKHLDKLPPELSVTKTNRVFTLNPYLQDFIRKKIGKVTDNQDGNEFVSVTDIHNTIISELKQDKVDLKHQVNELQKLLDQQQQLTLQSNQRIEQLEKQLQIGLEKAAEETSESSVQDTPAPGKKWWSFFQK
jgi:predicted transcriptional regulator